MKRLKDLEIQLIKPKTHYSNKEIDNILEMVNSVLYFYYFLFINQKVKEALLTNIQQFATDLKTINLTVGDKKIERRNEILESLRDYYKKLKSYAPDDNLQVITKMNQFLVSQFIREKENVTDLDSFYMNWLQKTKKFSEYYPTTDSFRSINNECINYFKID